MPGGCGPLQELSGIMKWTMCKAIQNGDDGWSPKLWLITFVNSLSSLHGFFHCLYTWRKHGNKFMSAVSYATLNSYMYSNHQMCLLIISYAMHCSKWNSHTDCVWFLFRNYNFKSGSSWQFGFAISGQEINYMYMLWMGRNVYYGEWGHVVSRAEISQYFRLLSC